VSVERGLCFSTPSHVVDHELLEARRHQFAVYRDELIASTGADGLDLRTIGEVSLINDGTHQTPRYTNEGVRFVSVENIASPSDSKKCISEEDFLKLYKVKPRRGDVLMTRIGSIGVCAVVENDDPLAYYVTLALIRPDPVVVNSRFLRHAIESRTGRLELRKRTLVNAVPIKINLGEISKVRLPLPSLEEQSRIADILDSFHALVNDLSIGLPAELAARRKQYEHYRDKLLTFEEAEV